MSDTNNQINWESVFKTIQNIIYWLSVVGPLYSIIKGAIIGTVEEIKRIIEKQKEGEIK